MAISVDSPPDSVELLADSDEFVKYHDSDILKWTEFMVLYMLVGGGVRKESVLEWVQEGHGHEYLLLCL